MSDSGNYQHIGAYPTVTAEKWKQHAINKLSKGYLLIISNTRNYANFYRGHESFESCSYRTARKLLREGLLEESGTHMLGTIYQLKTEFKYAAIEKAPPFLRTMPYTGVDTDDLEDTDDIDDESDALADYMDTDLLLEDGEAETDDFNSISE